MKPLREIYFEQLGIDPVSPYDRKRRKAALKRAYELRNFEIEHYWKRATYFWGYQAGIFAAFGLLLSGKAGGFYLLAVPVAFIGFFTALANLLAGQGSKFWQENWEKHIDMLEDEFEGRLHKTVWSGARCCNQSVSKINRNLGWAFLCFWPMACIGTIWLWKLGAGSKDQLQIETLRGFDLTPTMLIIGCLCAAFVAALSWYLSLSSPHGTTLLRSGQSASRCDDSRPLPADHPILIGRSNPARERP